MTQMATGKKVYHICIAGFEKITLCKFLFHWIFFFVTCISSEIAISEFGSHATSEIKVVPVLGLRSVWLEVA